MPGSSARHPSELRANVPLFSWPHKVELNNLTGHGTGRARSRWMKRGIRLLFAAVLIVAAGHALPTQNLTQADPLPSWNEGPSKQAILQFVQATTTQGSARFVPKAERIAAFDQDGTLWVEHPMYTQVVYCLDRVPVIVKSKPELANVEPFKTVLSGNHEAIAKLPKADLMKILVATLTGMSVDDF